MSKPGDKIISLLDSYLDEVNKEIDEFESELIKAELTAKNQED